MSSSSGGAVLALPNDYFAVTRRDPRHGGDARILAETVKVYDRLSVRRINIAYEFDPSLTFTLNLYNIRQNAELFQSILKSNSVRSVRIDIVPVVPLASELIRSEELPKLSVPFGRSRLLYVRLPPPFKKDELISGLRTLTTVHKLVPVIICAEKAFLSVSDEAADALFRLPEAVYQINFSNIATDSTQKLLKSLIDRKKTVILGTGDAFDACPYVNAPYYIKCF